MYAEQVVKQEYFKAVSKCWEQHIKSEAERTLYLMDFDAYKYGTLSFSAVLNNPKQSMGHGFVLAILLTDDPALKECELRR